MGFLDRAMLERIQPDASVVLASRAEVVEFDALVDMAAAGRLRVAIDVLSGRGRSPPTIPCGARHNVLFTAHIAGALKASYARIRAAMLDDAGQILKGLPPMRMQRAVPRLAAISRSR